MHKKENHKRKDEKTFQSLGLDHSILKVLNKLKFVTPTPIQAQAIPDGLRGEDIIGVAQTGTGKTLAFSLPIIQKLLHGRGRGLIMLPTRELALQVEETMQKIAKSFGLRTAMVIGGAHMGRQIRDLKNNPHVIIGTPGRIIDHMEKRTIPLHDVNMLVLDEADRMLDMGFAPQIKKILNAIPKNRQTMLFSATMPTAIVKMATEHMKRPTHVEVARQGSTSDNVQQEIYIVGQPQKKQLLDKLLHQYEGTVIVFSRTKYGARKICRDINKMKINAAEIHSNRSLNQRKEALAGFKSGKYRVLVATDIAARGIDVKNIALVINYDVPEFAEDYVHRIGRTGRAGKKGLAITFIMPSQGDKLRKIERLIESKIPKQTLPEDMDQEELDGPKTKTFTGKGGGRRRGGAGKPWRLRKKRGGNKKW